jgi:hypothetical protein
MNGIEGAWPGDEGKRRMRSAFERALDELDSRLDASGAPELITELLRATPAHRRRSCCARPALSHAEAAARA